MCFALVVAACGDSHIPEECATAADCAAPTGECQIATCVNGTCGTASAPDGTATEMQAASDCKKRVCRGGTPVIENDDTDVASDGNDCTLDGCSAGTPTTAPKAQGSACSNADGRVCDQAGHCVACNVDGDCAAPTPLCDAASHTCMPFDCSNHRRDGSETDIDCGGTCPPCEPLAHCAVPEDCKSRVCSGGICNAPTCTDSTRNGLETDVDCGGSCPKCGPAKGCNLGSDCAGNECTGTAGTCVPNCADRVKNNAETDTDCGGGTCGPCAVGQQCAGADANCVATAYCATTVCTAKKSAGASCTSANQCSSGQCVDGVCCNTACSGLCQACNVSGSVGTCTAVPSGLDPANECAGALTCNGAGGCFKANGATCASASECQSNFCVDGVCCNTACTGTCQACNVAGSLGTCANIPNGQDPANECAGTLVCNGAGACI